MANHDLPRRGSAAANGLSALVNIGGAARVVAWKRAVGSKASLNEFNEGVVGRLLRSGLIKLDDGTAVVTLAGRQYLGLEREEVLAAPPIPTGPRYIKPFTPLSQRSRSAMVFRDGAFDYRTIPSLMAGVQIPYKSSALSESE